MPGKHIILSRLRLFKDIQRVFLFHLSSELVLQLCAGPELEQRGNEMPCVQVGGRGHPAKTENTTRRFK